MLSNSPTAGLKYLSQPPHFVTNVLNSDYEGTVYLVKYLSNDVCTKLASLGNQNVLRDMSKYCISQVNNVHMDLCYGLNHIP